MTPGARVAAAIVLLDEILAGAPAEKALTGWARRSRFAGSGDRAAIRDHVYDALRCLRSHAALGGARTGRGLMIGGLRAAGLDPATLFTGAGHAPAPLAPEEGTPQEPDRLAALDCPDWIAPQLEQALGADFAPVMQAMQTRAPVFLRVNLRRTDRAGAIAALGAEDIAAQPHPLSPTALEVTRNARRVAASGAYRDGLVELQDAASQAVVDRLPLRDGQRVLDLCAGGGGKSLAMAGRAALDLHAYDIDPGRMADLPARADRAGVRVTLHDEASLAASPGFELVLADAPCSGSGTWRRGPAAKWALTPERLQALTRMQDEVLRTAAGHVAPGGVLAYATCSLLAVENEERVAAFVAEDPRWQPESRLRLSPLAGGDGFFLALLRCA